MEVQSVGCAWVSSRGGPRERVDLMSSHRDASLVSLLLASEFVGNPCVSLQKWVQGFKHEQKVTCPSHHLSDLC